MISSFAKNTAKFSLNFKRSMTTAKAIVYSNYGVPAEKIQVHKYTIDSPKSSDVVLKLVAHPINPSDINQIEGVYPSRPEFSTSLGTSAPSAVAGNEGLFEVIEVGSAVKSLKVGDWAIPNYPNYGTWRSHIAGGESDFIKLPAGGVGNLSKNAAACLSVNTCTAYELLTTIVHLKEGDWFVQNGGNSSVGRFAIQLGKILGLKSVSVVRDRPEIEQLKQELTDLGATHVITEEESSSREFAKTYKGWIGGSEVKLALNSIGGKSSTNLARKLTANGTIVTYGGMSKQAVMLPPSLFIFKNLTAKGYWITKNNFASFDQKKKVVDTVVEFFSKGWLKETESFENGINWSGSDEEILDGYLKALKAKGKQMMVSS